MESDDQKIAACGLDCEECPVYQASKAGDIKQKIQVAQDWSADGQQLSPEDISCNSCMTAGKKFQFCQICAIRLCATQRGLCNCAHCSEFACAKLEDHWKSFNAPQYRETLLGIRARLGIA